MRAGGGAQTHVDSMPTKKDVLCWFSPTDKNLFDDGFLTATPQPTRIIKVFSVSFDSDDRNYTISYRFLERPQELPDQLRIIPCLVV